MKKIMYGVIVILIFLGLMSCNITKKYTVTFDGNGGVPETQEIIVNDRETVDVLPEVNREGYVFIEWNKQIDGEGNEFTTETEVIEDITVYAIWNEILPNKYTLTLQVEGKGQTIPEEGLHEYDLGQEVNLIAIPNEGWKFVEWIGDVADNNNAETTVTMDSNKTVTAVFDYTINGKVTDKEGNGIAGIEINFSNEFSSVITDSQGKWVKKGITKPIKVIPEQSKLGVAYAPQHIEVYKSTNNVDFVQIDFESEEKFVFHDNVKYMTKNELKNISYISEDFSEIRFKELTPFLESLEEGDILLNSYISDYLDLETILRDSENKKELTENNNYNYLEYNFIMHEIFEVLYNKETQIYMLLLRKAYLVDVYKEGRATAEIEELNFEEIENTIVFADDVKIHSFEIISPKNVKYDKDGDKMKWEISIPVNDENGIEIGAFKGNIIISGFIIKSDILINWGLRRFEFYVTPKIEINLKFESEVEFFKIPKEDQRRLIFFVRGPLVPLWSPIYITPYINVYLEKKAEVVGSISTGFSYERGYTKGILYEEGSWERIQDKYGSGFEFNELSFKGKATLNTGLRFEVEALVVDTLGLNVSVTPYFDAKAEFKISQSELYGFYNAGFGVNFNAGASLNVLRIWRIDHDFAEFPLIPQYNIAYYTSGRVTDNNDNPMEGVKINFVRNNASYYTFTDENGYWGKHMLSGKFDVIPEKDGYIFQPEKTEIEIGKAGVNFTGYEDETEETIYFECLKLEQEIRKIIGKQQGEIYIKDVKGIERLVLIEKEIESIKGLEYFENLKVLDLSYNRVRDITSLKNLTNLICLFFENNQIKDISPLSNLINLETLDIPYNQINDISILANLKNLRILFLYNNQIKDLSPLSNLIKLELLALDNNIITNLYGLSNLINLKTLTFGYNQIRDISTLSELNNLNFLKFSNNNVIDISVLKNLTKLSSLGFMFNEVTDITALVDNYGLGKGDNVYMSGNYLDLTPGSQNMQDIQTLIDRGVEVIYDHQRSLKNK